MVLLITQQYQKLKYVRNNEVSLVELALFNGLQLLENKSYEDLVRVEKAVVDPESDQLGEQLQHPALPLHAAAHRVMLQSLDHHRLKEADVGSQGRSVCTAGRVAQWRTKCSTSSHWRAGAGAGNTSLAFALHHQPMLQGHDGVWPRNQVVKYRGGGGEGRYGSRARVVGGKGQVALEEALEQALDSLQGGRSRNGEAAFHV